MQDRLYLAKFFGEHPETRQAYLIGEAMAFAKNTEEARIELRRRGPKRYVRSMFIFECVQKREVVARSTLLRRGLVSSRRP